MNNKNYYDILEVSKDSSQEDIKKSFRKLSLKYHPDRNPGNEEAAEKFKEINEAYQTLGDPELRKKYDTPDAPDWFNSFFGGNGGHSNASGFDDIFSGDVFGANFKKNISKGSNLNITITIGIKEIYTGLNKTIKYKRPTRCSNCGGEGGKTRPCPHCGGTGTINVTQRTPFGIINTSSPCPHCGGTGKLIYETCTTCNGTGFEREDTEININLAGESLVKDNSRFIYYKKGADSKELGGVNGDLIVNIKHDYDTTRYEITSDNCIIENLYVPYYIILLGEKRYPVTLPDGFETNIEVKSCLPCNTLIRIPRPGFNDYIFRVIPKFPEKLSRFELDAFSELFKK